MTRIARLLKAGVFVALVAGFTGVATAETNSKAFEQNIEKYLSTEAGQQAVGKAVEEYFKRRQADARKQQEEQIAAQMEEQFRNPVKIDIGKSYVRGPENAKVTIVEFSDFQCPYCKKGYETMKELEKLYPNDVKFVFKNLPLPFHQQAKPAAIAALAAGKQGKFWEYHSELFENQDKLSDSLYPQLAQKLGLNVDTFKKDFQSKELEKQVEDEMAMANANGIQGTPGYFVNGVAVKGAYPVSHFRTIIDRWLSAGTAKKG